MGACISRAEFVVKPGVPGQTYEVVETADKLMLFKYQVDGLYGAFRKLDLDDSGSVSLDEFCSYYRIERSAFTDLVFKLIDRDNTNNFDFQEFMIFCYYYLTLADKELSSFTFEIFDFNNNGVLDRDEVHILIKLMWGRDKFEKNTHLKKTLEKLECNIDGDITKSAFMTFAKKYPFALSPAFHIQHTLQGGVCGRKFWEIVQEQRLEDHGKVE